MSALKEPLRQSARLVEHASYTYLALVKLEEEQPGISSTMETGSTVSSEAGYRVIELEKLYASSDPTTLVLTLRTSWHPSYMNDLDTFEAVLSRYSEFSYASNVTTTPVSWQITLVLVNEDIGEVAGRFDKRISAQEDPTTWERGHAKDSIIEVSEGQTVDDEHPLQFFITKFAVIVRTTETLTVAARALVLLTSDETEKGPATAHAYTGQAVKVSSRAQSIIEGYDQEDTGEREERERQHQSYVYPWKREPVSQRGDSEARCGRQTFCCFSNAALKIWRGCGAAAKNCMLVSGYE
ncbi:hypothetical protein EV421DRAFT_1948490 [Armillaria borealis]|uniref:Uncharacterized protein n=1 Tax=Armillaria borealis TaxID=47425 RepID=A0AA39MQS6_9AGAR|nr:hypothetical protein EV421DRAFT_1948490 [Armillaria borealis]